MRIDKGGSGEDADKPDSRGESGRPDSQKDRKSWSSEDYEAEIGRLKRTTEDLQAEYRLRQIDGSLPGGRPLSRSEERERIAALPPVDLRHHASRDHRTSADDQAGNRSSEESVLDQRAAGAMDDLPAREKPGDKTHGVWLGAGGSESKIISGVDKFRDSADGLAQAKKLGREPHNLSITSHVEVKFAMMMHERGLTNETLVVNNRPCPGRWGCDSLLERFLPAGGSLTVYAPDGFKKTYKSNEEDQRG